MSIFSPFFPNLASVIQQDRIDPLKAHFLRRGDNMLIYQLFRMQLIS